MPQLYGGNKRLTAASAPVSRGWRTAEETDLAADA